MNKHTIGIIFFQANQQLTLITFPLKKKKKIHKKRWISPTKNITALGHHLLETAKYQSGLSVRVKLLTHKAFDVGF
jgi:hypothetical protein